MTGDTTIDTPLGSALGERAAKPLATHLDLHTAGDLIYHFPRRYDERGEHTDMRRLQVGEQVTVLAQVKSASVRPMRQRKGSMLEITIGDGSGATLTCTFFNQAWRERDLRTGRWGLFAGKVTEFRGKRQLNGPAYQLLRADASRADAEEEIEEFAGALIPCTRPRPRFRRGRSRGTSGRSWRNSGPPPIHCRARCGRTATWSASAPHCTRSIGPPPRRRCSRLSTD
jgi:ATP-dependent DNA helicase RecG